MKRATRPEWVAEEYERIGREREEASRQTERLYRLEMLRACGEMIGWTAAGLVVAAFAFRATDRDTGMVLLWSGFLVNIGGVLVTLAMAWHRGHERGDW